MKNNQDANDSLGLSPNILALRDEIASGQMRYLNRSQIGDCSVDVCQGHDAVWILLRHQERGGFALRAVHAPGRSLETEMNGDGAEQEFTVQSSQGRFRVTLAAPDPTNTLLRCTVRLTPLVDLLLPVGPRDLYALDESGDPSGAVGTVHAAQRGLNSGLLYLTLDQPQFGSLLYFQNLTALNDYFLATETRPDGCVGGHWPELGYEAPVSDQPKPLPKGTEITLSDAYLCWSLEIPEDPRATARLFLDLLSGVYTHLERPEPEYHDWPRRAAETVRDLERAPDATVRQYGHLYVRPYVAAEHPDSMVQLTVLLPMRDYETWTGKPIALTTELRAGIKRFFDPELSTLRRFLPSVGKGDQKDKDPNEVDSWYLYHPLSNMARLAAAGDGEARDLFLQSLEFGIKAARHFKYEWPVQYKIDTLEVIKATRKPGDPGQSDVGGVYAYVCLQAYDLTGKDRYLKEAKTAIHALQDRTFDLEYQANTTTMGMAACLRLWRVTGDMGYRDQSQVFLACLLHNSLIWQSRLGYAHNYPIFLGVTCLHDGPYMALYECFDSYEAIHECLEWGGEGLPEPMRLFLTEYCKYTPSRAWYYYPKELPKEALATEVRNGHIDRTLSFPLEDLYADGQPAGQVGQEIYGCGAAFAFTVRAFHRLEHAPFLLFCEYPVQQLDQADPSCVSFRTYGAPRFSCRARLLPIGRKPLPRVTLTSERGSIIVENQTPEGHWQFEVKAGEEMELRWEKDGAPKARDGR